MRETRSHQEHVTLMRSHHIEHLFQRPVVASVIQFRCRDLPLEAHIDLGTGLSISDIPEFHLAERIIALGCGLVCRAHGQRHFPVNAEPLDHKRELPSVK